MRESKRKDQPAQAWTEPGAEGEAKRITPVDIQQKEFRIAFRGYSEREVDEFLDHLTEEVARLHAENKRLRESAGMHGSIPLDTPSADAEAVVKQANLRASQIVAEAQAQAKALAAGAAAAAPAGMPKSAMNAFLAREREFLQSLAALIQGHAESVKEDVRRVRGIGGPGSDSPATGERAASAPAEADGATAGGGVSKAAGQQAVPDVFAPAAPQAPSKAAPAPGPAERAPAGPTEAGASAASGSSDGAGAIGAEEPPAEGDSAQAAPGMSGEAVQTAARSMGTPEPAGPGQTAEAADSVTATRSEAASSEPAAAEPAVAEPAVAVEAAEGKAVVEREAPNASVDPATQVWRPSFSSPEPGPLPTEQSVPQAPDPAEGPGAARLEARTVVRLAPPARGDEHEEASPTPDPKASRMAAEAEKSGDRTLRELFWGED